MPPALIYIGRRHFTQSEWYYIINRRVKEENRAREMKEQWQRVMEELIDVSYAPPDPSTASSRGGFRYRECRDNFNAINAMVNGHE